MQLILNNSTDINKCRLCHDADSERYKILVSKIMCKFRTVVLTNLAAIA